MTQLQLVEATEPDIATVEDQIEALARDIEITTAVSAWRIGESLAKARDLHKYRRGGGFAAWIKGRLGWSPQHAERFINVFENLDRDKLNMSVQLSHTALFALAAPSTDDTIREEVERRLAEGQKVTAAQIEALKREAAEHKRRADDLAQGKSEADQHAAAAAAKLRDLEAKDREKSSVDIDAVAKKMEADYRAEADRKDREIAELRKKLAAANEAAKSAPSATVLPFALKGLTEAEKAEIDALGDEYADGNFNKTASTAERAIVIVGALRSISSVKADAKQVFKRLATAETEQTVKANFKMLEDALNILTKVKELRK